MNKVKRVLIHLFDFKFVLDLLVTKFSKLFDDKLYLKLKYRLIFGKELNIDSPSLFNEKLNWLKLYNRNPKFTMMVDKYWVKEFIAEKIGSQYVVPCYGCYSEVDEIDFSKLPERFFLKSTHDSGGGILVDKKKGIDIKAIRKRFNHKTLKRKNWFWHLREWPYKNLEPKILAEEYLDEGTSLELRDYKFYCFNGNPMYMYITNKGKHIYENFYDMDFNPIDMAHGFDRRCPEYSVPDNFAEMKTLASKLSVGHPFIRIDFFNVNGRLYFGEFTFYDWGGMKPLNDKWEITLGNLINLDLVKMYV